MKLYLISDNHDTKTGMRLAGIEGVVVHEQAEVEAAFNDVMSREDIGIVLVTERLVKLCPTLVYDLKIKRICPLIVEIPDRHLEGRSKNSITNYISEAIGVKF